MDRQTLQEYLSKMNIVLNERQAEQFLLYNDLLLEWNSFMNLTAITAPDDVLKKHFADSLALYLLPDNPLTDRLRRGASFSLIDIGTGAGFPAIPLKIAFPQLQITMLDSLHKRIGFLNEVISRLGLEGISAIHGRAEDYAKPAQLRGSFDMTVSRAVANMSTLSEYCLPYVRKDGYFIAYKAAEFAAGSPPDGSGSAEKEAAAGALRILGGTLEKVFEYTLPETDYYRCLAVVRKTAPTPKKYPRKAGLPAKEPIIE
ncbi:MAG: 16S rRNA (guanine(527)-N(7))-methyltransferase RsmG [Lachnospiraceae bacterium]|nr:16S rRNA (guanine(527)-N(7))-methyltransferase RsmG [Lachnospiraceae bacterium]